MSDLIHPMALLSTVPTGIELWECPTCGRRFLLTWHPWQRTVLAPGDEHATHTGSKAPAGLALTMRLEDGS